ncbi:ABC transporter permease [Acidimicrobiia bacterium EGI L10123]|uniref:ABC transporter permease n=1 Tax=Salinilacustrithrix flava TaxID=2957203 RepID=UPI003D7C1F89|nr:ABC transporter permease [Acidimicrobiia bacterium EGI L10123]
MLARTLEGARISIFVGVASVALCLLIGGTLGITAGYWKGRIDAGIMRVMDMVLAFPTLILALAIAAFLGPSLRNVVVAISFSTLPHYARLARATTMSITQRDFVSSSALLGAPHRHILWRHIAPNTVSPLLTYALLAIGMAIIVEASLSFLGLGVQPPTPSWGSMIAEGRPHLQGAPHVALVPGAFLFMVILSLNLLADSLRSGAPAAGLGR